MKRHLIVLITLALAATAARAQVTNTFGPRTYYEAFNGMLDALLIKGSSSIGTLSDQITYPVEIRAERLTNPQSSNSVYAVSIRTALGQQTQVDYIDYDELDAVIRGVQAISQANSSISPLDNFETVIRTRSGLSIAKLGRGTKVTIAITCGAPGCARNQILAPWVLDTLGRALSQAKAKLDLIAASGQ